MSNGGDIEMITIMGYGASFSTRRVLFTAALANVEYQYKEIDIGKGEQKNPEFLSINPTGKTPAMTTPHGSINESHALARYLARTSKVSTFYPNSPFERALIDQQCDKVTFQLGDALIKILYQTFLNPAFGFGPTNKDIVAHQTTIATNHAKTLDMELSKSSFFSGENMTMADSIAFSFIETTETSKFALIEFPHIHAWSEKMKNTPAISKIRKQHPIWS